jgi:hypothetical protein
VDNQTKNVDKRSTSPQNVGAVGVLVQNLVGTGLMGQNLNLLFKGEGSRRNSMPAKKKVAKKAAPKKAKK